MPGRPFGSREMRLQVFPSIPLLTTLAAQLSDPCQGNDQAAAVFHMTSPSFRSHIYIISLPACLACPRPPNASLATLSGLSATLGCTYQSNALPSSFLPTDTRASLCLLSWDHHRETLMPTLAFSSLRKTDEITGRLDVCAVLCQGLRSVPVLSTRRVCCQSSICDSTLCLWSDATGRGCQVHRIDDTA
ncbi:hypothetical protein K474DRAFT_252599 [Panus rudis PR-1116 ss-1]|nr:hypothetical protein K474DRAFT_252599 [Panus rudis PR-1116 ss-1]